MTLLLSFTIAVLFGVGAYLTIKRDLIRVVVGVTLFSYATHLFLMGSALIEGLAPIYPLDNVVQVSDPLVQALTLTAIVIGLGASGVLFCIIYRIYTSHGAIDQLTIGAAERADDLEAERFDEQASEPEELEVGR